MAAFHKSRSSNPMQRTFVHEEGFWEGSTSVDKLNKEIGIGLADPKINARIAELGGTVLAGSPADFGKRVSDDVEKWAKVIKFAHIKSD